MADETTKTENAAPETAPRRVGSGLIIVFVGLVVVVETAMFFFLVPTAEQVSALAEAQLIQEVQKGAEEAEKEASDENRVEEFQLGAFGETFSPIDDVNAERSFRVEVKLYGLIHAKNKKQMETEFTEKSGRLRHAIRLMIRNSELAELQDNQLGLLERRILTTCNHLLDEDLLLGVGFNDYQLIEE